MYYCYFVLCTTTATPSKHHCTTYLGDATKEITDKAVENAQKKGVSYSICGTKAFVEKSEIYKTMERFK